MAACVGECGNYWSDPSDDYSACWSACGTAHNLCSYNAVNCQSPHDCWTSTNYALVWDYGCVERDGFTFSCATGYTVDTNECS